MKIWTLTNEAQGLTFSSFLLIGMINFLIFATVMDVRLYLIIVLTYALLIIIGIKHISIHLLAIWISLRMHCVYLNCIHLFLCEVFYFLVLIFKCYFYIAKLSFIH